MGGLEKLNDLFGLNLSSMPEAGEVLPMGKGRIIKEGRQGASKKVAILSLGTRLAASCEAANEIESSNDDIAVTVADARFMKPLDIDLVRKLVGERRVDHDRGELGARVRRLRPALPRAGRRARRRQAQ